MSCDLLKCSFAILNHVAVLCRKKRLSPSNKNGLFFFCCFGFFKIIVPSWTFHILTLTCSFWDIDLGVFLLSLRITWSEVGVNLSTPGNIDHCINTQWLLQISKLNDDRSIKCASLAAQVNTNGALTVSQNSIETFFLTWPYIQASISIILYHWILIIMVHL